MVEESLSTITPSLNQITDNLAEETSINQNLQENKIDENDDFEFEQEEYEPDSDEENFFFKDFSKDSNNAKSKNTTHRRKRKSNKPNNQFNLSSFAKDLHDHRLSVIQPRQSTIVMTEDDEEELERLLQLQRQRMSIMTINESTDSLNISPPPMPSLDKMKQYSPTPFKQDSTPPSFIAAKKDEELPKPTLSLPKEDQVQEASVSETLPNISTSFRKDVLHKSSSATIDKKSDTIISQDSGFTSQNEDTSSNKIALDDEEEVPFTNTNEPIKRDTIKYFASQPNIPIVRRSISTASIKQQPQEHHVWKKHSVYPVVELEPSIPRLPYIPPLIPEPTPTTPASIPRPTSSYDQRKQKARKSLSMDNLQLDAGTSVTSAALDWIDGDSQPKSQAPLSNISLKPKSRGLFGSLRQVSRSKTTAHHSGNHVNPIRGLVRNLSTNTHQSSSSAGMSRAAMAVIQHNVAKHEQKQQPQKQPDIISQFISRASSTKIVNMDNKKERNQVVRRTIIYVQPDSLHQLLKNGGDGVNIPPLPNRNTVMSEESQEGEREYITATKISRQTSVRKKVVERGQLQSMNEDELIPPAQRPSSTSSSSLSSSSSSSNMSYMEGVELREMSDGSVMWGIVKKEGNRKSFYAPNKRDNKFELVAEEEEEGDNPPPIPKRSPHRQPSSRMKPKTDVYYSNDVTLPNLLKLMQHPGDMQTYLNEKSMDSVDDQLDEMIKIISSQQQK